MVTRSYFTPEQYADLAERSTHWERTTEDEEGLLGLLPQGLGKFFFFYRPFQFGSADVQIETQGENCIDERIIDYAKDHKNAGVLLRLAIVYNRGWRQASKEPSQAAVTLEVSVGRANIKDFLASMKK